MKLAHIVTSLNVGGAEVLLASLCRIFQRQGHEVTVHCLFEVGPIGKELAAEGFPVFGYGSAGRLATMWRLYRAFRGAGYDAVHCHNAMPTIWAAPALALAGVPTVVSTRHGLVPPPYNTSLEIQYSIASRFCAHIVGVCRATSENLRHAPLADPSRIVTVYNGAAPAHRNGVAPPRNPGFTFITVSRLAAPKDHETLLRAFAKIRQALPSAALWIVGDGPLRAGLEKLSADLGLGNSVVFWGERLNPGDFLANADLFVLSSKSEGLPMSLLEAISSGLPAIVSDVGGMAEVVRQFGGWVVPPGDVDALARVMLSCAADPAALQDIRLRAAATYRQHFTLEAMAEAYLRLYQSAHASKSDPRKTPVPE